MSLLNMLQSRKTLLWSALATAVAIGNISGCSSSFTGKSKKNRRKTPVAEVVTPHDRQRPTDPEFEPTDPFLPPDDTEVIDQAFVIRLASTRAEAWSKNCLEAQNPITQQWIPVGCNKDLQAMDGTDHPVDIAFPGQTGRCQSIALRIKTYEALPGSCREGAVCNGPYPNEPTEIRHMHTQALHFRAYQLEDLENPDPLIRNNADWQAPDFRALSAEMQVYRNLRQGNNWYRVFFEDQPSQQIEKAMAGSSVDGIDFNDFVVDIKSDGLPFQLAPCTREIP